MDHLPGSRNYSPYFQVLQRSAALFCKKFILQQTIKWVNKYICIISRQKDFDARKILVSSRPASDDSMAGWEPQSLSSSSSFFFSPSSSFSLFFSFFLSLLYLSIPLFLDFSLFLSLTHSITTDILATYHAVNIGLVLTLFFSTKIGCEVESLNNNNQCVSNIRSRCLLSFRLFPLLNVCPKAQGKFPNLSLNIKKSKHTASTLDIQGKKENFSFNKRVYIICKCLLNLTCQVLYITHVKALN